MASEEEAAGYGTEQSHMQSESEDEGPPQPPPVQTGPQGGATTKVTREQQKEAVQATPEMAKPSDPWGVDRTATQSRQ